MDIVDDNTNGGHQDHNRRAQTLETLQNYVQNQRAILERAQLDISRLYELKKRAAKHPSSTFTDILAGDSNNLDDEDEDMEGEGGNSHGIGKLSELVEEVRTDGGAKIIEAIDWGVFKGHDPTPLRDLASSCRQAHPLTVFPPVVPARPTAAGPSHPSSNLLPTRPISPYATPRRRESELQRLVRQHRSTIIDPAIEQATAYLAAFPADSESDGEAKKDPNKKRRPGCGLTVRRRGPGGVFVRKDVDESADVDISDPPVINSVTRVTRSRRVSSVSTVDSPLVYEPLATSKQKRTRRPSMKVRDRLSMKPLKGPITSDYSTQRSSSSRDPTPKPTRSAPNGSSPYVPTPNSNIKLKLRIPPRLTVAPESSTIASYTPAQFSPASTVTEPTEYKIEYSDDEKPMQIVSESRSAGLNGPVDAANGAQANGTMANGKLKPANYKVQWSVSEQHLLEKLLDDIPEGEKNRWAKISAAMQGRRTPRQVASRVQKYFLKLKKFGIEVAGSK